MLDVAIGGDSHTHRKLDRRTIQHRQHTRHPHAYRADVLIGISAEAIGASAEQLRVSSQMSVNFKSDYRFVIICSHWSCYLKFIVLAGGAELREIIRRRRPHE